MFAVVGLVQDAHVVVCIWKQSEPNTEGRNKEEEVKEKQKKEDVKDEK